LRCVVGSCCFSTVLAGLLLGATRLYIQDIKEGQGKQAGRGKQNVLGAGRITPE